LVEKEGGSVEKKPIETPPPPDEHNPGASKPMNSPVQPPVPLPSSMTQKYSGPPSREQVEHARKTLALAKSRMTPPTQQPGTFSPGQHDLMHIANYVFYGTNNPPPDSPPQTAPPQIAAAPARQSKSPSPYSAVTVPPPPMLTPMPSPPLTPVSVVPTSKKMEPPHAGVSAGVKQTESPIVVEHGNSAPVDASMLKCLETLRDAADPEVRYSAAKTLAACNWHEHPEAVSGLLYAARNDKHANMRVACIRSLAAMKASTPEVMTGLKPLTNDSDDWIRQEATRALAYLQTCLNK
jgi:hypothetical protein